LSAPGSATARRLIQAKRWREHGDRDAAHKLVTSLVAKIAIGYGGYGLPISEVTRAMAA
jgi:DNA-directed RNA polymerase sigma subunit (sigma70/sigma32)